jgi:hypothetical protein
VNAIRDTTREVRRHDVIVREREMRSVLFRARTEWNDDDRAADEDALRLLPGERLEKDRACRACRACRALLRVERSGDEENGKDAPHAATTSESLISISCRATTT